MKKAKGVPLFWWVWVPVTGSVSCTAATCIYVATGSSLVVAAILGGLNSLSLVLTAIVLWPEGEKP